MAHEVYDDSDGRVALHQRASRDRLHLRSGWLSSCTKRTFLPVVFILTDSTESTGRSLAILSACAFNPLLSHFLNR